jgi:AcrR family transcriptional regulator
MPRTPAENERIRQATREQILKAAMDLFFTKGYHATSIEDIARHAADFQGTALPLLQG